MVTGIDDPVDVNGLTLSGQSLSDASKVVSLQSVGFFVRELIGYVLSFSQRITIPMPSATPASVMLIGRNSDRRSVTVINRGLNPMNVSGSEMVNSQNASILGGEKMLFTVSGPLWSQSTLGTVADIFEESYVYDEREV